MIPVFMLFRFIQPFTKVGLYLGLALLIDLGLGLGITDTVINMAINWIKSQIGVSDVIGEIA